MINLFWVNESRKLVTELLINLLGVNENRENYYLKIEKHEISQ